MNTSEKTETIIMALRDAQTKISDVWKGGSVKAGGAGNYPYARLADILSASKAVLLEHGLVILASIYMVNRFQALKTVVQNTYQVLFYMFVA